MRKGSRVMSKMSKMARGFVGVDKLSKMFNGRLSLFYGYFLIFFQNLVSMMEGLSVAMRICD